MLAMRGSGVRIANAGTDQVPITDWVTSGPKHFTVSVLFIQAHTHSPTDPEHWCQPTVPKRNAGFSLA